MRYIFPFIILLALFLSCSRKNRFPEYLTQKVTYEQLSVKPSNVNQVNQEKQDSLNISELPGCLEQLSVSMEQFNDENQMFSTGKMSSQWEECKNVLTGLNLNGPVLEEWIKTTGLLFQLTAETKYAEQLQQIFLEVSDAEMKEKAASYVITKNVDHLHVNLFIPAEIEYGHSLGGNVKMVMETNYPQSGKVKLEFSMEKKRYIELFIRIPSWTKNVHVTAMGVKYLAPAGEYSKIAKKWQEGDTVEIDFSVEENPDHPN